MKLRSSRSFKKTAGIVLTVSGTAFVTGGGVASAMEALSGGSAELPTVLVLLGITWILMGNLYSSAGAGIPEEE